MWNALKRWVDKINYSICIWSYRAVIVWAALSSLFSSCGLHRSAVETGFCAYHKCIWAWILCKVVLCDFCAICPLWAKASALTHFINRLSSGQLQWMLMSWSEIYKIPKKWYLLFHLGVCIQYVFQQFLV